MKKLGFILIVLSFFNVFILANEIYLSRTPEETNLSVVKEDLSGKDGCINFRCHVQSVFADAIETPKGTFIKLSIPGFYGVTTEGEPEMPMMTRLIEVPVGADVSVAVINKVEQEFKLAALELRSPIYPAQPSIRKDQNEAEFVYNAASYERGYRAESIVEVTEVGILRDTRIFLLKVVPANYSPVDGKITFYNDVEIKVTLNNIDWEATKQLKQYASPAFQFATRSIVKSPTLASFVREDATLKYLIISDPMFKSVLGAFVDYKIANGYKVVVKYTDEIGGGADVNKVKAVVQSEFDSPSDGIAPTFLLLVGDKEQINAHNATTSTFITDLYYATVKGTDFVPDILVGRFSAQSIAELTPQLDKTMAYDQGKLPDYNFLSEALLVAGWDSGWAVKRGYPQIKYGTENYFTTANGFTNIAENTFLTSGSGQNVAKIIAAVSGGVGVFNYTAHGSQTNFSDPAFSRTDVDNLQNAGKYPLIIGNCCLTASFQVADCFGERWLRAANKGAIGFIGGSSYTYWDEDMWWGVGACTITSSIDAGNAPKKADCGVGAYESAFTGLYNFTNGGAMLAGNLAVQQANSSRTKYYFEVYQYLGDPGIKAYWATPKNPPVSK